MSVIELSRSERADWMEQMEEQACLGRHLGQTGSMRRLESREMERKRNRERFKGARTEVKITALHSPSKD